MPYSETQVLLDKYGEELRQGNITDSRLTELMGDALFNGTEPHTSNDIYIDFARTIGSELDEDSFHTLTGRMLDLVEQEVSSLFLSRASLAKAFIAYEFSKYPEKAEGHYATSENMKRDYVQSLDSRANKELLKQILGAPIRKIEELEIKTPPSTSETTVSDPLTSSNENENEAASEKDEEQETASNSSENSEEADYPAALKALKDLTASDGEESIYLQSELRAKVLELIKHVEKLKASNKAPEAELTSALQSTHKLLTNGMALDAYQGEASKMQGKPSKGLQILGGLMVAIGFLALAAGVVMSATGVGLVHGAGAALAGAALVGAGVGFFAKGSQKTGVSKRMSEVAAAKGKGASQSIELEDVADKEEDKQQTSPSNSGPTEM